MRRRRKRRCMRVREPITCLCRCLSLPPSSPVAPCVEGSEGLEQISVCMNAMRVCTWRGGERCNYGRVLCCPPGCTGGRRERRRRRQRCCPWSPHSPRFDKVVLLLLLLLLLLLSLLCVFERLVGGVDDIEDRDLAAIRKDGSSIRCVALQPGNYRHLWRPDPTRTKVTDALMVNKGHID